jgi:hypothetical protein
VNGAVFQAGKTKMEMDTGSGGGTYDKINLEDTSGDKALKSDEEWKGLLNTLFKEGKKIFHFTTERRGNSSNFR